jgi:hypothetical protein
VIALNRRSLYHLRVGFESSDRCVEPVSCGSPAENEGGCSVRNLFRSMSRSKVFQLVLILVAAALSLVPLAAEKRQGNSIRWSVEGDRLQCEYYQLPSFSHIRSYDIAKIDGVTKAADSADSSVEVVRLQLSGLNLNIPSQSSALIWNFDSYLSGLQRFYDRAQAGESTATYSWRHPWLIVGIVSIVLAVGCWVLVFVVLLAGPRSETESNEEESRAPDDR